VVEDGDTVRGALVTSLEQLNYQTLEAANGEQALAVMAEQEKQIALVLSDVVMPRMGGKALFHALREKGWQTPVILLTGHPMDKELEELRAQGLSAWLTKPPSIEHLAQVLADALR
jgi:two-component system cell cycle sensor histidine kinase/response regulator CckA